MNQMARHETPQTNGRMELSEDVASMRAAFHSLRQIEPRPLDLATWYALVKGNSDGGASAPPFRSLQAA